MIQKSRHIASAKRVQNERRGNYQNRDSDDSPAAFEQNQNSHDSHGDVERNVCASAPHDALEIHHDVKPASRAQNSQDHIIPRKRVARRFFRGRKKQERQKLHERQMRRPQNLRRDRACERGVKLEQAEQHRNYNSNMLPPTIVLAISMLAVKFAHQFAQVAFIGSGQDVVHNRAFGRGVVRFFFVHFFSNL